jgi:hypothetical protein
MSTMSRRSFLRTTLSSAVAIAVLESRYESQYQGVGRSRIHPLDPGNAKMEFMIRFDYLVLER